MRDLAAAADQIDNWIRRRVIVSCCGTHPALGQIIQSVIQRFDMSVALVLR
jgi:hypothetical protein